MELIFYCIIIGIVATDAIADGQVDETGKRDHIMETLNVALYFALMAVLINIGATVLEGIGIYVCLRICLFNLIYNKVRGLPFNYIGSTDPVFDKWIKKIHPILHVTFLMLSLFFSIVLLLNL